MDVCYSLERLQYVRDNPLKSRNLAGNNIEHNQWWALSCFRGMKTWKPCIVSCPLIAQTRYSIHTGRGWVTWSHQAAWIPILRATSWGEHCTVWRYYSSWSRIWAHSCHRDPENLWPWPSSSARYKTKQLLYSSFLRYSLKLSHL